MGFRLDFISQFNHLPCFTKQVLRQSAENYGIPPKTLNSHIARSLKKGELISLKRDFYVTGSFYKEIGLSGGYNYFIANKLLNPSYLSMESALQYYGMLAEAVNIYHTSVTTKAKRGFNNRFGIFAYKNISEDLFTGYVIKKLKFEFAIAEPYKAMFDYLYYRTNYFRSDFQEDILEDLRIDVDDLADDQKKKFRSLLKKYTNKKINLDY